MKFVLGETIDKEHLRSCALGGISIASELLAAWDTCDIATEQAKRLIKEGDITDEDTAFQIACEDQDLYTMEWECLVEYLTELMAGRNPGGNWECNAQNFGWRSLDGYKYFAAETGADFLSAILPKTDCTFKIFDFQNGEGFAIQNWHHDSPVGREWYYITSDKREECPGCGDKYELSDTLTQECPECKQHWCNYCFGDEDVCDECYVPPIDIEIWYKPEGGYVEVVDTATDLQGANYLLGEYILAYALLPGQHRHGKDKLWIGTEQDEPQ